MTRLNYYFMPNVRRGFAASLRGRASGQRAETTARAHVSAETIGGGTTQAPPVEQKVAVYGPQDVLGFDPNMVDRTDPKSGVGDFEPNYFPQVEFIEPDFPWRFTAAEAAPDSVAGQPVGCSN